MIKICKITLLFLLFASTLAAQQNNDQAKTVKSLFQILDAYQYKPPARDKVLSNHIFDVLIKTLDPYGLLFTDETIVGFKPYCDSICSNNSVLVSEFVTKITEKYKERLLLADSIVDKCFRSSLNLSEMDSLILIPESINSFSKDDPHLEDRWRKYVKYGMLKILFHSGTDSIVNDINTIPDSLYNQSSLLAKKTRIREKRWISQLLNCSGGIENFVINSFLNSVTACYDPHSNYFSNSEKEKFESSLSKDNYAFGFEMGTNLNEEVIISVILPGSPLWYSKQLEKGDVILKIKIPGQEETDLAFASIGEVDNIFNNLVEDWIEMTVRKLNGSIKKVELSKGKFDTMENQVVGFILKGEKPVGYLWFSSFYTRNDRFGNMGCSRDFLKEMIVLKESGAEGLIVDLRNNPGGDEREALEIAAYLAGNGPFAIRRDKSGVQIILEKKNSIKWYDDPIVVLVNGASASGAELLTAILQDYNRAVVIGTSTFGKASEQLVFPLGRQMPIPFNYSAAQTSIHDFVKVTCGKIFRITGESYQKIGVRPDILVPDILNNFIRRESEMPFALENERITPSVKFSPFSMLPIDTLEMLSKSRILKSEKFGQILSLDNSMKNLNNNKNKVNLKMQEYKLEAENRKHLISEFESVNSIDNKLFTVENTSFKIKEIQSDSTLIEMNGKFKDSVQKDIYIGEAFSVVIDLLGLNDKDFIQK